MAILKNLKSEQAELERVKAELAALKAERERNIKLKVSDKGACSLYGLGRFPITLYVEQWEAVIERIPEIQKFLSDNQNRLKRKGQD